MMQVEYVEWLFVDMVVANQTHHRDSRPKLNMPLRRGSEIIRIVQANTREYFVQTQQ